MYRHRLYEKGVRVPVPYFRYGFLYGMEFRGGKYRASPLLKDVDLEELGFDPLEVLDEILDQMDMMFNGAQMVHGDLSEHNIIWHDELPYIIDVLQAKVWHPKYNTENKIKKRDSLKTLRRDIESILNHFKTKYRVSYDPAEVLERMPDEKIDDWIPDDLMQEDINLDARINAMEKLDL